jgi:tight adherence protein B
VTVLAALLAALAAALCIPVQAGLSRLRPRGAARWPLVPVVVVSACLVLQGRLLALGLIVLAAGTAAFWLEGRGRSRGAADVRRAVVIEACETIASELRAGQPPLRALERSLDVWPELEPVVAACRLDADVPSAFRRVSRTPGAGCLTEVASAWQVSQSIGGGLAQALDRVAETARGQLATHRVVVAELSSAQATARMVALLPVVMLVLSNGTGADPWRFLLQTTPGLGCLGGGLLLAFAGMLWIDRIVSQVHNGEA